MQIDIFDLMYQPLKINKPIRLIEFFGGYGSQLLALKYLGANVEQWKLCEWAVKSIQAYKDVHCTDDNTNYSENLTTEEVKEYLFNKGISSNYNEPMTKEQVFRLSEEQARTIYNNIKATHNLVNIQQVKGNDLDIIDKDKYTYLLTYSFPCQDLSLAGQKKGMSDTSTRSGMLWEVERILKECDNKPQVLLMENVPQVHSIDNLKDFQKWITSLEEMGYKNYYQDLIATDYGIPQTRNRTFMVSVLGNYKYTFPEPIPLEHKLKDLLEKNVDENYFLSNKMQNFLNLNTSDTKIVNIMCDELLNENKIKENDTILTNFITRRIKENDIIQNNNITPTLTTSATEIGVCVKNNTNKNDDVVVLGNYHKSNHNASRIVDSEYSAPTVMENHGTITAIVDKPKVLGGIGEKDSNNNTQWKQQNRIYDNNVGISITTCYNPNYIDNNLRIRKLTPKECFRLQSVKDIDTDKMMKNQSNASAYHLAGDSICIAVLIAIFGEMLGIEWKNKIKELLEGNKE